MLPYPHNRTREANLRDRVCYDVNLVATRNCVGPRGKMQTTQICNVDTVWVN
jgi:hypothetical protein